MQVNAKMLRPHIAGVGLGEIDEIISARPDKRATDRSAYNDAYAGICTGSPPAAGVPERMEDNETKG